MSEEKEKTENEIKKEFLWSYQNAKRDVIRLQEQLAELKLNKISPSVTNAGMPHGNDSTDLSDYMAKVDEIEREIVKARYERIGAFKKVRQSIEAIEDQREKNVLTYRYLKGYHWEDICIKMNYSWKQVHRFHSWALEHLLYDME